MTAPVDLACDCERCTSPLEARIGPILAMALMVAALAVLAAVLILSGPDAGVPVLTPDPAGTPAAECVDGSWSTSVEACEQRGGVR